MEWLVYVLSVKRALAALEADKVHAISTISESTADATTGKLLADIVTWMKQADQVQSLSHRWKAKEGLHCT